MIESIRALLSMGHVRLTLHARAEMDADDIGTEDLTNALLSSTSELIEDYPEDPRGHSCLLLAWQGDGRPVHVCCAIHEELLIIITVYRPAASLWSADWRTRR